VVEVDSHEGNHEKSDKDHACALLEEVEASWKEVLNGPCTEHMEEQSHDEMKVDAKTEDNPSLCVLFLCKRGIRCLGNLCLDDLPLHSYSIWQGLLLDS